MKNKEIVQDNKLIAKFMGNNTVEVLIPFKYELGEELPTSSKICTIDNIEDEVRLEIEEEVINGIDVTLEVPNYNSSWNWLMPVIEKIESIKEGIYQVDILQEGCKINVRCELFIDKTISHLPDGTTKIDSVYKAINAFIYWYNKNK